MIKNTLLHYRFIWCAFVLLFATSCSSIDSLGDNLGDLGFGLVESEEEKYYKKHKKVSAINPDSKYHTATDGIGGGLEADQSLLGGIAGGVAKSSVTDRSKQEGFLPSILTKNKNMARVAGIVLDNNGLTNLGSTGLLGSAEYLFEINIVDYYNEKYDASKKSTADKTAFFLNDESGILTDELVKRGSYDIRLSFNAIYRNHKSKDVIKQKSYTIPLKGKAFEVEEKGYIFHRSEEPDLLKVLEQYADAFIKELLAEEQN